MMPTLNIDVVYGQVPRGLGASQWSGRLRARPAVLTWVHRSCGAVLVGLGLKLAFEPRP
jgi:threonine/homoserine/homoserine lactone efflux protein